MKLFIAGVWILLCTALLQHQVDRASAATDESDVTGLQLVSGGWRSNSLNWTGSDPCGANWQGVGCTGVKVTQLSLTDAGLTGRLLASIGNLVNLVSLDLSFNPQLGGPLPSALGKLVNLQYLSVQACSFVGPIPPELGQLRNLKFLGLNMNKLSGSIPPELGFLTNLTWLDPSENNLDGDLPVSTSSSIGVGLDNLTSAMHFHLNNNSFTGTIPKEISILPNLIHLLLDNNNMGGEVPIEIASFTKLEILRLDNNKFEGDFPDVSNVTTLQEIHLRGNRFKSLPNLSKLNNLLFLSVGSNQYAQQTVPSWLQSLNKLQALEFDQANLVREFPSNLLALPNIETISFAFNQLNGSLDVANVSQSLSSISLIGNGISDVKNLPQSALYQLSLGGNPACSRFSSSFIDCAMQVLPEKWSPSQNCTLQCSGNAVVNPTLCSCAEPLIIQFQFNAPTFLTMTDDRDAELRRQLAMGVNLSESQIWISSAQFTENFRMNAVALFFPTAGMQTLASEQTAYIINQLIFHHADLVGFDPYHPIVLSGQETLNNVRRHSYRFSGGAIAGICVGVAVILGLALFFVIIQKRRADKAVENADPFASWGSTGIDNGDAPIVKGVRGFTFAELKKASNNFTTEIGAGGYGKVYKGYLMSGETVAIKRAQVGSMQGANEFKTEIELLSRLHHRNLVGLLGFCYMQGEQMLVYEYMANGTIRDHLLGHSSMLSWSKRLEIAVGAARGIAYLHDLANPPIIHRDIKSSNILLDETLVAKVADLGLSKVSMVDDGKTHVSTQVKGTLGYLDPEYYMTQKLTDKSDVYSFGVVLLELVTAKQPIENGKYIVREMRNALARDEVEHLLDPSIAWKAAKGLRAYLSLAMRCADESADSRPSMNGVVKELEALLGGATSKRMSSSSSGGGDYAALSQQFHYSGGVDMFSVHPK